MTSEPARVPILRAQSICKSYGGVRALVDVDLELYPGEVVALLGHNGAGKSTMVAVLSGVIRPESGDLMIGSERREFRNPREARDASVETIFQTLALADNLDATANLFLGREIRRFGIFRNVRAMRAAAVEVLQRVNPRFSDVDSPVRSLSGGQRQSIAIARALHFEAKVLIMDEPTAALGVLETSRVKEVITRLRNEGVAVLMISHDMNDVFDLADRVVVMANGKVVGGLEVATATKEEVLSMIILGESGKEAPDPAELDESIIEAARRL